MYLFDALCWDDGHRHPDRSCTNNHRFSFRKRSNVRFDALFLLLTGHYDDNAGQSPVCMELVLGPLVCPTPLAVVAVTRRT